MPTTGSVCNDGRIFSGAPHGGQQREFAHLQRDIDMLSFKPERTRHAAATGFDCRQLRTRNPAQYLLNGREGGKRFLVAMAVQKQIRLR